MWVGQGHPYVSPGRHPRRVCSITSETLSIFNDNNINLNLPFLLSVRNADLTVTKSE